jgi:hypothetical protein
LRELAAKLRAVVMKGVKLFANRSTVVANLLELVARLPAILTNCARPGAASPRAIR